MISRFAICVVLASALAGCSPSYSPNTYASNAVQQANKAEQGIVVGVREVAVSASGTVGTVTGAAAGGIAGSQAAPAPLSAFTALGGSLIGGIAGNAAEHAVGDTKAFEYIVRKPNGDLVSVTQKDTVPLALGQKVLVIAGAQARVVPDYTVAVDAAAKDKPGDAAKDKPGDATKDKIVDAAKDKPADAAKDQPADATKAKPADVAPDKPADKPSDPAPAVPASASAKPPPAADAPATDQPKVETGP